MPRVGVRYDKIAIGLKLITIEDFISHIQGHLKKVPWTKELEVDGNNLVNSSFNPEELKRFILGVCDWGGMEWKYNRGEKVIAGNSIEGIWEIFLDAVALLNNDPPQIDMALDEISNVNGLKISYGSKHLRFLRPDICSVLDQVVHENLGYGLSIYSYERYSLDCANLARYLEESEVDNPMQRQGKWFPAEIDMGVYAFLKGWRG